MEKHGMRYTQLYKVWAGIKDRTNPKSKSCKNNYKKMHISNGFNVERAFTENNDRKNYYEYNGQKLNINQISKLTGLTVTNVWNRLNRGWDIKRIIEQPARKVVK